MANMASSAQEIRAIAVYGEVVNGGKSCSNGQGENI